MVDRVAGGPGDVVEASTKLRDAGSAQPLLTC
jgi:hypothetical protein